MRSLRCRILEHNICWSYKETNKNTSFRNKNPRYTSLGVKTLGLSHLQEKIIELIRFPLCDLHTRWNNFRPSNIPVKQCEMWYICFLCYPLVCCYPFGKFMLIALLEYYCGIFICCCMKCDLRGKNAPTASFVHSDNLFGRLLLFPHDIRYNYKSKRNICDVSNKFSRRTKILEGRFNGHCRWRWFSCVCYYISLKPARECMNSWLRRIVNSKILCRKPFQINAVVRERALNQPTIQSFDRSICDVLEHSHW